MERHAVPVRLNDKRIGKLQLERLDMFSLRPRKVVSFRSFCAKSIR